MSANLLAHTTAVRFGIFLAVFVGMAIWEILAPRRQQQWAPWQRWPSNLLLVAIDTLVVRLLVPFSLTEFAAWLSAQGWGLLNAWPFPAMIGIPLAILLLDLVIYAQHVAFHYIPMFWRIHRMHHSDLEFDVTTGVRFHPIEIVLSVLLKMAAIAVLGAPAIAVLLFEILLNATSMFNHGNVLLPEAADSLARQIIVTPDMHRVHHSVAIEETNSNFGFNLSIWDRVFGTYRAEPKAGQLGMIIGIEMFRNPTEFRVDRMLTQPFRDATSKP